MDEASLSQRVQHYCSIVVFWAWLAQILETNASLSKAVALVQSWCVEAGLPRPCGDTGGYRKGSSRLNMSFLEDIGARVHAHLKARIHPEDTYRGHVVKSIDGSSLELDDTEKNQSEYTQPTSQKPGCGFPIMGITGMLNHSRGGWEDFAKSTQAASEAAVSHRLLHCLNAGDILCGDRAFCTYQLTSRLSTRGIFSLLRFHAVRRRVLDWRKSKRPSSHQRLVTWKKSVQQSYGRPLSVYEWKALPDTLEIRLIRLA